MLRSKILPVAFKFMLLMYAVCLVSPFSHAQSYTAMEQACYDNVQDKIAWDQNGDKHWDEENLRALCKGARTATLRGRCFQGKMPSLGWKTAVDQCSMLGQPGGGTKMPAPSSAPATQTGASCDAALERQCEGLVQDQIPWTLSGNRQNPSLKHWAPQNLKSLCGCTTNPAQTVNCFQNALLNGHPANTNWRNAIAACNANQTATSQPSGSTPQNPGNAPNAPTQAPHPSASLTNLAGNWEGYNPDGSLSAYVWQISQSGSSLTFTDVGTSGLKFTGTLRGNIIHDSNGKTGKLAENGSEILWSDNITYRKTLPRSFPLTTSTPLTLGVRGADDDFYMIFTGDTQFPWSDVMGVDQNGNPVHRIDPSSNKDTTDLYSDDTNDADKRVFSEKMNRQQVTSMLTFANTVNLKGVVINGDLTAYGNQHDFLDMHKSIYLSSGLPIYPGLGNHDYSNNVLDSSNPSGCYQNGCTTDMVRYMYDFINNLKPPNSDINESAVYYENALAKKKYRGSMAYSWDIGNVHFVQLNFHPAYARNWSGYNAGAVRQDVVEITSSMNWLEADLATARNAGKSIILNMHDALAQEDRTQYPWSFGGHNFPGQFDAYKKLLQKYGVSAVFGAHIHQSIGLCDVQGNTPVFLPGGADYSTYLLVHFKGNTMTVEQVSSTDSSRQPVNGYDNGSYHQDCYSMQMTGTAVGGPVKVSPTGPANADGTNVYPLDTSMPGTPFPVIHPSTMQITFFNQGGYQARFTLSYNDSLGNPVTQKSGNMSLGMRTSYDIPWGATGITVAGEEDTGWVGEPTKQIFSQPVAFGGSQCFKAYGTTLSPSWNADCSANAPVSTPQPAPPVRTITFFEQAGFVASMSITYTPKGSSPTTVSSGNQSVGFTKTFQIPDTEPNSTISVSMTGKSTMNNNFFSTTVPWTFTGDVCFKAWGTLFSPQGGSCN